MTSFTAAVGFVLLVSFAKSAPFEEAKTAVATGAEEERPARRYHHHLEPQPPLEVTELEPAEWEWAESVATSHGGLFRSLAFTLSELRDLRDAHAVLDFEKAAQIVERKLSHVHDEALKSRIRHFLHNMRVRPVVGELRELLSEEAKQNILRHRGDARIDTFRKEVFGRLLELGAPRANEALEYITCPPDRRPHCSPFTLDDVKAFIAQGELSHI